MTMRVDTTDGEVVGLIDRNGNIIKRKVVIDTTDRVELSIIKGDKRLILSVMPFALFMIYCNLTASGWNITEKIKIVVNKKYKKRGAK